MSMILTSMRFILNKLQRRCLKIYKYARARSFGTNISSEQFIQSAMPKYKNSSELARHMRERMSPCFFLNASRQEETVTALDMLFPQMRSWVVKAADQVCDHIFDLLGSGPTALGNSIDWHSDFKTNHSWNSRQYYAFIRPAPYPGGYDIKIPWELSRCQHFAWLGQAYWFTKNEKYAKEFLNQVSHWIQANPPEWGVNWACPMDVALRAVNWLWGYYFFKDSPNLTDDFYLTFLKSLWIHGRHIFHNLENKSRLTNNHYLADLVGLVFLGILLPEYKEASIWRNFGLRELENEIIKQVYPDGVNFEASISYHRLAAELFLSVALLANLNQYSFSAGFMTRLEKMLEFTMYVTRPDGSVPLIGDNDNGRIFRLKVWPDPDREWSDHRYLLAIGAVLFNRQDFSLAAGDQWEEAIWLLGQKAYQVFRDMDGKPPLSLPSRAFPDSGFYILRNGEEHMVVDAGSNGQNGLGGHAHNDNLSLVLYTCGKPLLVDPGTFTYTSDYDARNEFRSTAYHNTVMVDSQEQCPFTWGQLFLMGKSPPVHVLCWEENAENITFEAGSEAYLRLPQPVVHRRIIHLYKKLKEWQIEDRLDGEGSHTIEIHWHMPKSVNVDQNCHLELTVIQPHDVDVQKRVEKGIIAVGYGKVIHSDHIIYTLNAHAPVRVVTSIKKFLAES